MADKEAQFAQIYRDNSEDLFLFIQRLIREENVAQDLLHDTFLNFFKVYNNKNLPAPVECRMYLFRAARNLVINYTRRAYNRKVDLIPDYDARENPRDSVNGNVENQVLARLHDRELEALMNSLLSDLQEDIRTAVVLRYYHDMHLEEISTVLDVSVSTVYRMVQKGVRFLYDAAKKEGMVD